MRYVISFICLLTLGCEAIIPGPVTKKAPSFNDDQPILAVTLTALEDQPAPAPAPDDKLKPGDDCPECIDGKSGDGINTCNWCKGDGRVDEGDPILKPVHEVISSLVNNKEKITEIGETIASLDKRLSNTDEYTKALMTSIESLEKQIDEICSDVADINARCKCGKQIDGTVTPTPAKEPKYTEKTVYTIEYKGKMHTWDNDKKMFIAADQTGVKFLNPMTHPSTEKFMKFCKDGFCTFVPIDSSIEKVQVEDGIPERPSNDSGSN